MNICQDHWDQLRAAIDLRGLGSLVADDGEHVIDNLIGEMTEGRSIDNYDPLVAAWCAIANNGMEFIAHYGGNPVASMLPNCPEYARCIICYPNWMLDEHTKACPDLDDCGARNMPRWEWMIDRAADDQVEVWKEMHP